MPDDNTAESSTAVEEVSSPLEGLSSEQRTEWLKTGNLPTKEDSATSKETSGAPKDGDKPAPESESGNKQEPKKGKVDQRIQELLDERHELRTRLEKLEKGGDKKADPPPADKPKEKAETKLERPKRPPKLSEWTGTFPEHEDAMDKYYEELADFKAKELLAADRTEREKASQDEKVEAENAKIIESWKTRRDAAMKEYPDFKEIALDSNVPVNATTDGFILKDPLGAKLLYALGKDPAEAKRIAALDPFDTMEALVEIKRGLSSEKAPEKKNPVTKAPPPPTELTGRNTEASDEAEAALVAGDFPRYQTIMNRRETTRK